MNERISKGSDGVPNRSCSYCFTSAGPGGQRSGLQHSRASPHCPGRASNTGKDLSGWGLMEPSF